MCSVVSGEIVSPETKSVVLAWVNSKQIRAEDLTSCEKMVQVKCESATKQQETWCFRRRAHSDSGPRGFGSGSRARVPASLVFLVVRLVLVLVLVVLSLLLGRRVLVLLVLAHQVVHVGLGLGELHLIHPLPGVPVQERLATEHGGELLRDALEELLDGGRVADEGGGHLEAPGRDVAHSHLDVVRDPLDEVARVLVADVEHLFVHFFHRHTASEDGGAGQIAAVARVACRHHVLGVVHLLGELGHRQGAVLLRAARRQWREPWDEEMQPRKRNHVDGEFAQIGVQLPRETETRGDARHGGADEVVQVTIRRRRQLQRPEADVVKSLVVDTERLVRVLHQLVHRQGAVVRLHDGIGNLRRGNDGERVHDAVWILFSDFGDQQRAHPGPSSSAERVRHLEPLQTVAGFRFLPHDVKDGIDELSTLRVVPLGPVVAGPTLPEDEVVGSEDLSEGAGADRVHGPGLQVEKDGAGHVLAARRLIVVDVDALELQVRVAVVGSGRVDPVLVGDNLPKLGSDLVAALPGLDVKNLPHGQRNLSSILQEPRSGSGVCPSGDVSVVLVAVNSRCIYAFTLGFVLYEAAEAIA